MISLHCKACDAPVEETPLVDNDDLCVTCHGAALALIPQELLAECDGKCVGAGPEREVQVEGIRSDLSI